MVKSEITNFHVIVKGNIILSEDKRENGYFVEKYMFCSNY